MRPSTVRPYSSLATRYDRFVGHAQFHQVRRIFEHCVRRHALRFSCVADLGCGSGLFARHLASRWGVPVYAVDRSPQMLGVAARRCRRLPCTLLLRDFRHLVLPETVDLITMFSFTLNLQESAAALSEILDSVWRNLSPGGSWIVDFLTPRQSATPPSSRAGTRVHVLCHGRGRFCLEIGVLPHRGSRWQVERHCARLLSPVELRNQFDRHGFVLIDALDQANLGPAQHFSPALVFVVRKPRTKRC